MQIKNYTTNASAATTAQHTPGPWATDIEEAVEIIKREGHYNGFQTFKTALGVIADIGKGQVRKIAQAALDSEHGDSRISGAVVYRNDGSGAQGGQICSFEHEPENEMILDAETIANARLMAKAWLIPELLEALELLAQQLESFQPVHLNWHLAMGQMAKQARAVITKATGI